MSVEAIAWLFFVGAVFLGIIVAAFLWLLRTIYSESRDLRVDMRTEVKWLREDNTRLREDNSRLRKEIREERGKLRSELLAEIRARQRRVA